MVRSAVVVVALLLLLLLQLGGAGTAREPVAIEPPDQSDVSLLTVRDQTTITYQVR